MKQILTEACMRLSADKIISICIVLLAAVSCVDHKPRPVVEVLIDGYTVGADSEQVLLASRQIESLEGARNLRSVKQLVLSNNNITDIGPLAELTTLEVLSLQGQPISNIDALKNLERLILLELEGTSVGDLSPVSKLKRLKTLDASKTRVTRIYGMEGMTGLRELYVYGTHLYSVEGLPPNLEVIGLPKNFPAEKITRLKLNYPKLQVIIGY